MSTETNTGSLPYPEGLNTGLVGEVSFGNSPSENLEKPISIDTPMILAAPKTYVVSSGHFDPVHIGHIRYLNATKSLGDIHIAIVNSDLQVRLKKGRAFMPEQERLEVIAALRAVDIALVSIDTDRTVCRTIVEIFRQYSRTNSIWQFCKGGDSSESNVPEVKVCRELGIDVRYNVGGGKIQSSSELLRGAQHE